MRFACCAVLAVLPICLHAAVVVSDGQVADNYLRQDVESRVPSAAAAPGNWAMVARIADECNKDSDTMACVAVKAAAALERAARMNGNVQLLPGVIVAKNVDAISSQRDARSLPTEEELRNQLTPDAPDHTTKVANMIIDSGLRFLQSRTLQLNFPEAQPGDLASAIEEGRGKLKKKFMPILGLLAVKIAAVLPFLLGLIGFFALKALIFGKLALIIASVLAFQKFAGSSGGSGFGKIAENFGTANVASAWPQQAAPSNNGGYYRRSMEQTAQQMAYNGQMQPSVQTSA